MLRLDPALIVTHFVLQNGSESLVAREVADLIRKELCSRDGDDGGGRAASPLKSTNSLKDDRVCFELAHRISYLTHPIEGSACCSHGQNFNRGEGCS